jgi:uncharacterized damage-inducible protein DinB
MDPQPLIDTWRINNRINLFLLDGIGDEDLTATLLSKGRSVCEQFAHIHNVRLMWLKASIPEALAGLAKIEKGAATKATLADAMTASATAVEKILAASVENGGKVKGFKPHVTAFLAYLVAHDAHHRSQVILALKQAGKPLDKKLLYGMWEWGTR